MTPTKLDELLSSEISKVVVEAEVSKEKQEIMKKIAELEEKLKNVKGKSCLVYSRVVGYMSPTLNWNPGKFAEWQERETFKIEEK